MNRIIVDSREKPHIRKYLDKAGICYEVEAMRTGDYRVVTDTGDAVIERKSISDFMGSMFSGRLDEQLYRLSKENIPILLLTGTFNDIKQYFKSSKIKADVVQGQIASAIVRYGLRSVIWIQNIEGDPHEDGLVIAVKLLQKIAEGKLDKLPPRKVRKPENAHITFVRQVFGVPSEVAEKMLFEFGTVRNLLSASTEQLKQIKGVGPMKIKRLHYILDEVYD